MITPPENTRDFSALIKVVESLRGPKGCPWDKEQTHQSLTQYAIEEAHELADAIESHDQDEIIGELGDLLLQVVLHAEIAKQDQRFDISDVIESISAKMIRRHPHVFSDMELEDTDAVSENWQKIKTQEKEAKGRAPQVFDVPKSLPALQRAFKIGQKTKKKRFDWQSHEQVLEKVEEELQELKEAIVQGDHDEQMHEVGDLLFSVAQLARHLGIEPEQSLRLSNSRFENRFLTMQEIALENKADFNTLNEEELESLWQQAKARLKKKV